MNDGVTVFGALVMDGVSVTEGVKVGVCVNVFDGCGRKAVALNVALGVLVNVEVGVGVSVMVCVTINGVPLVVGIESVPVEVTVAVKVSVGVNVSCEGLGARASAIQPMQ